MKKGFIFDQNKCVGCHACVVACQIENGGKSSLPWREITTFNSYQFTDIPLFHYSLACNHCEEAPCMEGCPALAYSRDDILNIVKHHHDKCIGCKYCTWTCPYDAPKYNPPNGVVEKCTLCEERIRDDKKPACAHLCPTGALEYGEIESFRYYSGLAGFPENNIQTLIKIVPLKKNNKFPQMAHSSKTSVEERYRESRQKHSSKITLKSEWVLIAFTVICSLLAGISYASFFNELDVNPYLFLGMGVVAGLLTFLHLGQKKRAWRAVLNISQSWLSREIMAFGLFILLTGIFFLLYKSLYLGVLAVLCGFFLLYSIDKVYRVAVQTSPMGIHSANVLLTGIFFAALLSGNEFVYYTVGFIKLALYIYRKVSFMLKGEDIRLGLTWLRLILGFIIPPILFFTIGSSVYIWIFISILLGELIDRIEFYMEIKIMSSEFKMIQDLKEFPIDKKYS